MDGARCKVCGAKHWSYEPHTFETEPAIAVTHAPNKSVTHAMTAAERVAKWRKANPEKHAEVQRNARARKRA